MKATTEPTYVLITPARNEELHLEQTIQSVVGQTFRPAKWVIVSDGSTDRTDEIARRECFEAIGGYKPSRDGGVDLLATLSARMHGWQTRAYTGKLLMHHRQQGTAHSHPLLVKFHNGRKDYMFGGHPLWEFCRAAYHLSRKPYILGGCLIFGGPIPPFLTGAD